MANRIASCPSAKQIVGFKGWLGWADGFNFPGFKGNFVTAGGVGWTSSADGGAVVGGEPNFAVGDLVLLEFPANGEFGGSPPTDYLTGTVRNYPKFWQVYVCTQAISGSATGPDVDTTHFSPWDFKTILPGSYGDDGEPVGGPSGWPLDMAERGVFAFSTDTAFLDLTVTTALNDFPLWPDTISGLRASLLRPDGGTVFSGEAFQPTNDACAAFPAASAAAYDAEGGTFAYDWTFAVRFDGSTPTYTSPGTAPSTAQSRFIFPALYQTAVGWAPVYSVAPVYGGTPGADNTISQGTLQSLFSITGGPVTSPALTGWAFSATSISFTFKAWVAVSEDQVYFDGGSLPWAEVWNINGPLCSAAATVTQTLTLGGTTYTLAEVAEDATTLMNATAFSSIGWGTSWTNKWDASGTLVSTQNFAASVENSITATCAVGTPVKWGVAVNGLFTSGVMGCYASHALVDVCGVYCARTYNCPTVTCAGGTVDGFAPVGIEPPGTPGESVAIYPSCTC